MKATYACQTQGPGEFSHELARILGAGGCRRRTVLAGQPAACHDRKTARHPLVLISNVRCR